ncbi:MAG: formyltransferase family protein [Akkermansiaceae bacterium]|nr:formyltransferase family protein [Akkermansiaceae bacterium]
MRVAFLTNQTTHHAQFVRELLPAAEVIGSVLETTGVTPPFDTGHAYLEKQSEFEVQKFFGGDDCQIADLAPAASFANINDPGVVETVQEWQPDLTVAFGVRRVKPEVINAIPGQLLNLHGGDPEEYRGLDTHLWAIYHSDFNALVTALHVLAPRLDTGNIVQIAKIPVYAGMPLHELRAANTQVCIDLVRGAIDTLNSKGEIPTTPQRKLGRYYSFMPSVMKDVVKRRFEAHTAKL